MKKIIKFSFIILCAAILLLAGCQMFDPFEGEAKKNNKTGLEITLGGLAARTMMPNFNVDNFEINFFPLEEQPERDPLTLPSNTASTVVTGLQDGLWGIYVAGKQSDKVIMEGAGLVTIISNTFQGLTIDLLVAQSGEDGTFIYTVEFPEKLVYMAEMYIEGYNDDNLFKIYYAYEDFDERSGSIELEPGFYFAAVYVYLYDGSKQLVKVSVIHIYSGMETEGVFAFTYITIGGELKVKVGDETPDFILINLFDDLLVPSFGYAFTFDCYDKPLELISSVAGKPYGQ